MLSVLINGMRCVVEIFVALVTGRCKKILKKFIRSSSGIRYKSSKNDHSLVCQLTQIWAFFRVSSRRRILSVTLSVDLATLGLEQVSFRLQHYNLCNMNKNEPKTCFSAPCFHDFYELNDIVEEVCSARDTQSVWLQYHIQGVVYLLCLRMKRMKNAITIQPHHFLQSRSMFRMVIWLSNKLSHHFCIYLMNCLLFEIVANLNCVRSLSVKTRQSDVECVACEERLGESCLGERKNKWEVSNVDHLSK